MRYSNMILIGLAGCLWLSLARAELLIIKQDKNGVMAPLDDTDIAASGKIINEILLKYQWPMCIAASLTPQEIDELLTADKPYGEEQFIEKKIRTAQGEKFEHYRVVFIPTTVYELFCIKTLIDSSRPNYMQTILNDINSSGIALIDLFNVLKNRLLVDNNWVRELDLWNDALQKYKNISAINDETINNDRIRNFFYRGPKFDNRAERLVLVVELEKLYSPYDINLTAILDSGDTADKVREKINALYTTINELVYSDNKIYGYKINWRSYCSRNILG
jgi:hypothetical protein